MDAGRLQQIRDTIIELEDLESRARMSMRELDPSMQWPLGDATRAAVRGAYELLAEIEMPRVDPLRASLIGILRADGYVVTPPMRGEGLSCLPPQEMAVHPPTDPPPTRDAEPHTFELEIGESLQIVGGPYDGKRAWVTGYSGDQYTVSLYDDAVEIVGLPRIEYDRVFVKSGEPEKAPAEQASTSPKSRKPEVPITAAEWTPTKTQIAVFLKDKDLHFNSEEDVLASVAAFKAATMASSPDLRLARWSSTFQAWRKARLGVSQ